MKKSYPTGLADTKWACSKAHLPAFKGWSALPQEGLKLGGRPETEVAHRAAVECVVAAMREPSGDSLSLGDMADIAYLSPFYFAHTFRRITGVPPGEFSTALRLQRAKELLLTTDVPVGEVCFEVGYASVGTFTTRFTRLVGLSPSRLRRLPEELPLAFEHPRDPPPALDAPPESGVAFRVRDPGFTTGTRIYVGLFLGAVPQRHPASGTILTAPGVHHIAPVPDGNYHLMAAALPRSTDPLELLLPGDDLRVGRGERSVSVRDGRAEGVVGITLRPPRTTDPPVLIALAGGMLFYERHRRGRLPHKKAR